MHTYMHDITNKAGKLQAFKGINEHGKYKVVLSIDLW